jgi:hypothetical protein
MTSHRLRFGNLSGILLAATAIISADPCALFSQDLESRSPSTLRSQDDYSAVSDRAKKQVPSADDAVIATLPDAPMPQDQAQDPNPPTPAVSGKHLNQYPILSPGLTRAPMTIQDKFLIYAHKSFGPPALILPAFGAGLGMINPPSKYPKEWKDGAGAFGRNYGYRLADRTSRGTAQFLTGAPFCAKIPATSARPAAICWPGPYMRWPSPSSIRPIPEELPSPQVISLQRRPAGSLG